MGYRSKVIMGVKNGELSDKFDKILQRHDFKTKDHSSDYLKIHTENDGMKFYTFDRIKWYEGDDWCGDMMKYLEEVEENDRQDYLRRERENDDTYVPDNVFCVGLGEEGELHSKVGDYWEYVEQISEINLID